MKGITLSIIGYTIIAIVGVALLILLVNTNTRGMLVSIYCKTYSGILFLLPHQEINEGLPEVCKPKEKIETVELTTNETHNVSFAIAAYSIACMEKVKKLGIAKNYTCYQIFLKTPTYVSEDDVTDILISQNACRYLENSEIDASGATRNCGERNQLVWKIEGDIIKDQKLILIKYIVNRNSIEVIG